MAVVLLLIFPLAKIQSTGFCDSRENSGEIVERLKMN